MSDTCPTTSRTPPNTRIHPYSTYMNKCQMSQSHILLENSKHAKSSPNPIFLSILCTISYSYVMFRWATRLDVAAQGILCAVCSEESRAGCWELGEVGMRIELLRRPCLEELGPLLCGEGLCVIFGVGRIELCCVGGLVLAGRGGSFCAL